jgi:hypothetical protein
MIRIAQPGSNDHARRWHAAAAIRDGVVAAANLPPSTPRRCRRAAHFPHHEELVMHAFKTFFSCAVLFLATINAAHAGLWSSSNAVRVAGGTSTMTVSFTGDGRTTDAQVDVAIPNGFAATVTGLNGGTCVVFAGTATRPAVVRVITPVSAVPLPQAATSLCRITLSVNAFADSGRFAMFHDVCAGPALTSNRCELDPGYFTVAM